MNWQLLGFEEYNQWQLHWLLDDLVLAVLGILIPIALWFFWTSLNRVKQWTRKLLLFALRLGAFTVLLLIILKPELEFRKTQSLKNSIAILLDNSKSLSIKTRVEGDEVSRINLIKNTLEANASYLESLEEKFNVEYYFFSNEIERVGAGAIPNDYRPHRSFTNMAQVFDDLTVHYEGQSLQGVFLFSDGADLTQESSEVSRSLLERIKGLKSPVHTLQAGTNNGFKDLAIENVSASDFGFVQQSLRISLTVFSSSLGNRNIPLMLKEGDHILASKTIEVREDTKRLEVELEFTPNKIGKRIYTLSLPKFAGEFIHTNNEKEFEINVVRDRIRILHLNGRPSWDSRFLREVLAHNPKVDLLSFFILRNMGDDVEAPVSELSLIPFPSNLLFDDYLNSFDLVIFQNFKYDPFIDKKYLENIRKYVGKGGAFLMVGGDLSFQGGGYSRTPIEEILPVKFRDDPRPFIDEAFKPTLNKEFSRHPILRLEKDPEFNLKAWQSLPLLQSINIGLFPDKNAHALVRHTMELPVLVTGNFGKGRTALLATDSIWNWNLKNVGSGGSGRYFQRFWNNVIDWLIAEPETRRLQLESDKDRYREGEQALIKFSLMLKNFQPAAGMMAKLILKSMSNEAGKTTIHEIKTDEQGEGVFPFLPDLDGFYSAMMQADIDGETLEEEIVFSVLKDNAEFEKPLVNENLLKKISEVTGGKHLVLQGSDDLSLFPFANPDIQVKSHSRSFSLWDNWWAYGLVVGFLVMDWYLRRKSGLS
jgi:uncharacterized membrane protein